MWKGDGVRCGLPGCDGMVRVGLWLLMLALVSGADAQTATGVTSAKPSVIEASNLDPAPVVSPSTEVLREIDDPSTGNRWLLLRDPEHPGGPGRLVLANAAAEAGTGPRRVRRLNPVVPRSVIHGGDQVVVEETTPVLDARYEGVALGPAEKGKSINVRLKVNGRVVRAVVLGPGRAALDSKPGGR